MGKITKIQAFYGRFLQNTCRYRHARIYTGGFVALDWLKSVETTLIGLSQQLKSVVKL